ncbi:MAG: ABC transporter permease subunit [Anaerolineaceae bacterium]|nr:ABC transporter permease subunit [Anaerolineaceae bacterium]
MSSSDSKGPIKSEESKLAYYEASQWTLMRRRFAKHKVAVWMLFVILALYMFCMNADFFAPYDPEKFHADWGNVPPQLLHFGKVEGHLLPRPYVYPYVRTRNPITLAERYYVDKETRVPIKFFVQGRPWKFLWLWETRLHLFGVEQGQTCFLLGTGKLGQDVLSRILYGGRISLLVGFTGVFLTFFLGIFLGGISGYFGGKIDLAIQRVAEVFMTVPKIPIWLALAAAIPKGYTPLQVYFFMTLILACMGWPGLCRVVRGKLLSLREEDYARAAILAGASERRVIFVHLVPNFMSHIIASLTLRVPMMILAETSLSFLGLGLRKPLVSWGVLLKDANSPDVISNQPWVMLPAAAVILAVLAFNFAGEGLRDAADPYTT